MGWLTRQKLLEGLYDDRLAVLAGSEMWVESAADSLLFVSVFAANMSADEEAARWGDPQMPIDDLPPEDARRILDALGTGRPYRLAGFLVEFQDIAAVQFEERTPEQHQRLRLLLPLVKLMFKGVLNPEEEP